MISGRLKVAIVISVLLHAAALGTIFFGASLFSRSQGEPAGGGTVSVWVDTATGEGAANGAPAIASALKVKKQAPAEQHSAKQTDDSASASAVDSSGSGGGDGGGSGTGYGQGSGSNQVLSQIWKRIDRAKYYPQLARSQKLEGKPRVTFEISEDGSVHGISIASSCGREILDGAAIETIKRASPLPYFPGPITVTVKYSLAD